MPDNHGHAAERAATENVGSVAPSRHDKCMRGQEPVVREDGSIDRSTVTCTFTNVGRTPIRTCSRGKLSLKDDPKLAMESVVMCTGRLNTTETKVVTAPWLQGFADDLCYSEGTLGKSLDWSKCEFSTEPFTPGD